jgi:replicative DNA helicase
MSLGKLFLSAVIAEKSVASLLQHGAIAHLFKASEEPTYEFVREFVKQYQALPTPDTVELHTGETLIPHSEPSGYYFDLLEMRHIELSLRKGLKAASDLLLPENKDPEEALKKVTETVMALIAQKHAKQVVDFRDAYDMLIADYAAKWNTATEYGLQLGWPTLDDMSGGLVKGDTISFVGRPAAGKTWQMLHGALHGWKKAIAQALSTGKASDTDQSRMFVSMEMAVLPIQQRLAAMYSSLPASQLKHATLSTKGLKQLKHGLTEIKGAGAPFYVVDGNLAATVEDLWMLARQLMPAAIFIDGAYLVKHPTERDRFRRVAENADLIKSELAPLAPVVCSWQFARSAAKKNLKKGEKAGLDDIGYTDAIGQVSSLVLGLFEEESVETLKQRKVEILKGRNGEVGSFSTRWDFQTMDFSEIVDEEVGELQFL